MSTIEKALAKQKEQEKEQQAAAAPQEEVSAPAPSAAEVDVGAGQAKLDESAELAIPLQQLEAEGFVSITGKRSRINEEFRGIKHKILNNAFGPLQ